MSTENITQTPLDTIVARAQALAEERHHLATVVQSLQRGIDELKAQNLAEIRQAIDRASTAWSALQAAIETNADLFVKPRTQVAHGIKFGIQQGKATLQMDDPARTVALIEKHYPADAELLISTVKTPAKAALVSMPANDLARLGCSVVPGQDTVLIKPADGDIDKLVRAMVAAVVDEGQA
jgi:hypothetical protein